MLIDIHTETSASRGGWPEIEPSLIEDGRPAVPSFPLDVLPSRGAAGSPTPPTVPARLRTMSRRHCWRLWRASAGRACAYR